MIDWSIHTGDVLTVLGFVATIATVLFRVGGMTERINNMRDDIKALNEATKELTMVARTQALQDQRLALHERWIDELRHGVGLVVK